jgi:tRNA (guanine26-N2/guanine27-N2)-dimethyltransferase
MYDAVREGKAEILVPRTKKLSKQMPVFYNPDMKLNRELSVLLLNSIGNKKMQIADPLAGTGIRSIRFLLELKKSKIKNISINDSSPNAVSLIKKNLKLNKIKINQKTKTANEDANLFLLKSSGFDYVDIDPFGYPGKFLPAAVQRLARKGILAVTATDTSALAGTAPKACMRKYWAKPLRDECMHETGLRILIRFTQLIGAQFEKALQPTFCYSKQHYLRAFFTCEKGKKRVDAVLKQHGFFCSEKGCAGPLWVGKLWDTSLVKKMTKTAGEEAKKFLKQIVEESAINSVGFYDIHSICKQHKLMAPKRDLLIKEIRKKGFRAARTHFSATGIRSSTNLKTLLKLIKKNKKLIKNKSKP